MFEALGFKLEIAGSNPVPANWHMPVCRAFER